MIAPGLGNSAFPPSVTFSLSSAWSRLPFGLVRPWSQFRLGLRPAWHGTALVSVPPQPRLFSRPQFSPLLSDFPAPELPSASGGFSQLSGRLRPMPSSVPTPSLALSPTKLSAFKDRSQVWSFVSALSLASGSRLLPSRFQLSEPGCMPPAPTFGTADSGEGDDELRREIEEGTDSHILNSLKPKEVELDGVPRHQRRSPLLLSHQIDLHPCHHRLPLSGSQLLPKHDPAAPSCSRLIRASPKLPSSRLLPDRALAPFHDDRRQPLSAEGDI